MKINNNAPARYTTSIEINAPIETVWAIMSDIENWSSWNPDIKKTEVMGEVKVGTIFTWKAKGSSLTSRLEQVEPLKMIAWTGKTMGIKAVHIYRFTKNEHGTTVASEESWDGLPVKLMKNYFQKTLVRTLTSGLAHLKAAAEERA